MTTTTTTTTMTTAATADDGDALRAFARECATMRALALEAVPQCADRDTRVQALTRVERHAAQRARFGVTDCTGRARYGAYANDQTTDGDDDDEDKDDLWLFGVEETTSSTTRNIGCDVIFERASARDADTGTKLWMGVDGVCFVTCCKVNGAMEATNARANARVADAAAEDVVEADEEAQNDDAAPKTTTTTSTQFPEVFARDDGREEGGGNFDAWLTSAHQPSVRALRNLRILYKIPEIARAVNTFGRENVLVVCEYVDGHDARSRAGKIRDALDKLAGVDGKNVVCAPATLVAALKAEASLRTEAGDDATTDDKNDDDTTSRGLSVDGWFRIGGGGGADAKKKNLRDVSPGYEFLARVAVWNASWRQSRATKLRNEIEYDTIRDEVQFWAMFLRKDDESMARERDRAEAEAKAEAEAAADDKGEEGKEPNKSALARAHETASLLMVHTFLKTAIEGVPVAAIAGAPEMAWKHYQKYPNPERAPLMNAVSSHSVIQYAAALMFAWLTPGPMGAHATHFMNRFRICLFFACLSGASPLDPTVVSTAIGLAAGTDKENLEMSPVIRFMAGVENDDDNDDNDVDADVADDADAAASNDRMSSMNIDGEVMPSPTSDESSATRDGWTTVSSSFADLSTLMQAALDRVIAEGTDLKRRTSKTLADFLNSGNRVVLKSRRRAMKIACDAKADAISTKKLAYDDAEALGKRVFDREFSRDVARSVSALICGPKFIAAVAADITQVINSTFTTYIAMSSIDIFLPMVEEYEADVRAQEAKVALEAEAAAALAAQAAVAALTTKNAYVKLTVTVHSPDADDESGEEYVKCACTPTPKPGMVEQLFNTSKIISEKTAALKTSTAEAAKSSAEAMSDWATKTTDSVRETVTKTTDSVRETVTKTTDTVRKETNRSFELASENAKASIESAKSGLESASAFLARTTHSLKESAASSASSVATALGALSTSDSSRGLVSIDVRSLPPQRVVAALESEHVDRVIVEHNLLLKMPVDVVLSKALKDIVAELRNDSSKFVEYRDDEMVTRAIQRLLELVVESGDAEAVAELTKLGVVPRPKSKAQEKLEALRDQFRRNDASVATNSEENDENADTATTSPPPPSPSMFSSRILSAVDPRSWSFALSPMKSADAARAADAAPPASAIESDAAA